MNKSCQWCTGDVYNDVVALVNKYVDGNKLVSGVDIQDIYSESIAILLETIHENEEILIHGLSLVDKINIICGAKIAKIVGLYTRKPCTYTNNVRKDSIIPYSDFKDLISSDWYRKLCDNEKYIVDCKFYLGFDMKDASDETGIDMVKIDSIINTAKSIIISNLRK